MNVPELDLPKGPLADQIALGRHGDSIMLIFDKLSIGAVLTVDQAEPMFVEIAKLCHKLKTDAYNLAPDEVERIRRMVVIRVANYLRKEISDGKNLHKPHYLAEKCVELMLTQVT